MKYWFLAIVLFATSSVRAQQELEFTRNIDSLVQQYLKQNDLPSAAVGIVYAGNAQYAKRLINPATNDLDNAESRSVYNIASVAKPFVASAIMILENEGLLDIDDPVSKYLQDFKIDSPHQNNITIRQLLTHTSGLPNTSTPTDYEYIKVDTTDEALTKHIRSLAGLSLAFKSGKKHSYSNVGFEILGEVIARVSGQSFDDFMRVKLFEPLHMYNTSYLLGDFKRSEIVMPHEKHPFRQTGKFPYNRAFSPSGNLFTTIDDLNKWMIFNLNGGDFQGFRPIPKKLFDEMWSPQFKTEEDEFVGLSWFIKNDIIFHDGKDLGYTALMMLYRRQGIGITVLVNHVDANCNELLNQVARSVRF